MTWSSPPHTLSARFPRDAHLLFFFPSCSRVFVFYLSIALAPASPSGVIPRAAWPRWLAFRYPMAGPWRAEPWPAVRVHSLPTRPHVKPPIRPSPACDPCDHRQEAKKREKEKQNDATTAKIGQKFASDS